MKTPNIGGFALAIIFGCGIGVASAETKTETIRTSIKQSPTAEVPARAADLVAQSPTANRDQITTEVVRFAVKAHPTIACAIVGSIAKKTPAAAITAAATAAKLHPKQVTQIAQAAAAAAPAQAGGIVKALCKVVPGAYRDVALTVAFVVPGATEEILAGLSEGLPTLKAGLDSAIASYQGKELPSVAAVLDRTSDPDGFVSASFVRGPTIGPPFIALSGTPTNAPPGTAVPPGGRDYAKP